ncbi:TlpA family protein disulfide reductase [Nitrincola tapanii]|uniref:TlpA family protein disulfide reductase n=1 Tax=Nitrincola tapanii TaxID=1708751 RepID=A0A5A9W4A0_9GAMM|nr:TlpA disulfide reductase family protein [Nitrincola tapanii]KAA0875442.1 TlpA family protein disulfide reductase [Nitrincola tapanii]
MRPRSFFNALLIGLLLLGGSSHALALSLVKPAPEEAQALSFQDLQGQTFQFTDYADQVLVVNFWATWCPPCVKELPSFQRLQETLQEEAFQVILINVGESPEQVVAFLQDLEQPITLPQGLDENWKGFGQLGLRGLPSTLIYDRQGKLVERVLGEKEWDAPEIVTPLRRLLTQSDD